MNSPDKWLNGAAAVVARAADGLAIANAAAKREADKRDWQELERILKKHGICNVISIAAQIVDDMGAEYPHRSNEAEDYELAREVLELAAQGCDLPYGTTYQEWGKNRQRAIDALRDGVKGLRA